LFRSSWPFFNTTNSHSNNAFDCPWPVAIGALSSSRKRNAHVT
jgi:hypothetical protein